MAWVPSGTTVTVAGHVVRGGMVYVGAPDPRDRSGTPCVIDPSLDVARSGPDTCGAGMGYWPSYSQIPPQSRLAYLQWLADGRSAPETDIGYVFLYFYGLERRMFVDGVGAQEAETIAAEVQRLRTVYGANNSFNGYSAGFLQAVAVRQLLENPGAAAAYRPDLTGPTHIMPLPLKLAIGARIAAGEAISFELAMAGLFGLPADIQQIDPRVLEQARPQLLELMRPVFETACPAGFRLVNRKDSRLRLVHQCATAGLVVDLGAGLDGRTLPDPATLTWTKLVKLVAPVAARLEAFAKLKAYRPARLGSLSVFATLPDGIGSEAVDTSARQARDWLQNLPKPIAKVDFAELAARAIGERGAKWTLRHHRAVGEALAATHYGLEPHPANGGLAITDSTAMFVFPDATAGEARSKPYAAASVGADVVTAVARLDGADGAAMRRAWLARLGERLPLEPGELVRLEARLNWLDGTKPSMARIKAGLTSASATDRDTVAWSAATAAAAGGMVGRDQVAVLEKVYDTLGLGRRDLYAALHGAAAAGVIPATEPVQVAFGHGGTTYPIPRPPIPVAPPSPGTLDAERIRAIKAETERVTSVLADIFVEEETPAAQAVPPAASGAFPGLDGPHANLLGVLRGAATWTHGDFERKAHSCGLLPDGALETINEWAFDRFDEPLIQDRDVLAVNVELLERGGMEAHAI